jgi:hypothetical protein
MTRAREPKAVTRFADHVLEVLEGQLLEDGQDRRERRPSASRPSASREEVARRHYWIAAMTQREGLPVDWEHTALRMAQALLGLPEGDRP